MPTQIGYNCGDLTCVEDFLLGIFFISDGQEHGIFGRVEEPDNLTAQLAGNST
jgi:hypothetical protein